jgi:hypothetical protein
MSGGHFVATGTLTGGGAGGGAEERGFIIKSAPGIAPGELAIDGVNGGVVNLNASQRAWSSPADLLDAVFVSQADIGLLEYSLVITGNPPVWDADPDANPIVWSCSDAGGTHIVDLWARLSGGTEQHVQTYVIVQDNDGVCPP